jgi:uncharacterized protein
MDKELKEKEQALISMLERIPSCVIAFSGGLDSVFLGIMAGKHVPGRALCVTMVDASTPDCDIQSAREAAERNGLEHTLVVANIEPAVRQNPRDRCYHCKSGLFRKLDEIRIRENLRAILDGENASDSDDDRPGSRAARECGIVSPLADAGLTKDEIRILAKEMGLEVWDRPASACLSSRIPFGTPLDDDILRRVDATEQFIRSKGIRMIRARVEGKGTRLELGQDENTEENRALLASLEQQILAFGWSSMTTDPSGYVPAGLRRKENGK